MTDQEKEVSRRVLNRALFHMGHTSQFPADDEELRLALLKALRIAVGGNDGMWAALQLLAPLAEDWGERHGW
jgi:hypothetical protein